MFPKDWQLTTVGAACSIKNNLRFPINTEQRAVIPGPYPYFGPTGVLAHIDHYRIDEEFAVIGEDGDHFLKYRHKSMTLHFKGKANVNNHAHVIGDSEKCSPIWFYYWFMHRDLTPSLSRQGVGRYKLTKRGLEKLEILLPPKTEQLRISNLFATWDRAISAIEHLIASTRKQKQALMNVLLKPMKPDEWHKEGWRRIPLGEIVDIDRRSLPSSTPDQFSFRYISLSDVDESGIASTLSTYVFSDAPSRARRLVEVGDILFSTVRPNLMGHIQITKAHADCVASTGFSTLSARSDVNADYLFQYLFSEDMKRQIDSLVAGSSFPAIAASDIVDLEINLPKMQEQLRVALLLKNQDSEIVTLQKMAQCLKLEKQALMAQLLMGKRRIRLPVSETAAQV
jgi:type I restriction enzyme S subunit